MSHEPLGHHEVDVPRLGRVRLPRVRVVASATTVGVLLGGAIAPVIADSQPERVASASAAAACPPWWCQAADDRNGSGEGGARRGSEPVAGPAIAPTERVTAPRSSPETGTAARDASPAPASEATARVVTPEAAPAPATEAVELSEAVPAPATEPAPAPATEPVTPAEPAPATEPVPPTEAAPAPADDVTEPASPPATEPAPADDVTEPASPPATQPAPADDVTEPASPPATEPAPADDVTAPASPPEPTERATPPEADPAPAEDTATAPEPDRGTRVGGEAYWGWGGGAEAAWNDEDKLGGLEVGIGYDSSLSLAPDTAVPSTGPYAEASVAAGVPGTNVRGRATVTLDSNGVSGDVQYSTGLGRTRIGIGPEGVEAPEARFGGSVPGFTSPVGGHVSVGYRGDMSQPPAPDPAKLDSDGDGYTDGSLEESPEVGGRRGMNPAGTARSDLDSDMDGVVDRSDRTIGRDSDEDGVPDDMDQKPGEVDIDRDADGVADQFDRDIGEPGTGAVGTTDSDGDGFSDGSFAESPEMGGRGDQDSYGSDQSAPASDDTDTGAVGTTDSDGDGFSDGSFAESPEMGGRGDQDSYGSDQSAPASDDTDTDTDAAGTTDSDSGAVGTTDTDTDATGTTDSDSGAVGTTDSDTGAAGTTDSDSGAVGTTDSDGDGFSDGSFAESPEMGGRGDEGSYGADQSAPASDDAGDDDGGA